MELSINSRSRLFLITVYSLDDAHGRTARYCKLIRYTIEMHLAKHVMVLLRSDDWVVALLLFPYRMGTTPSARERVVLDCVLMRPDVFFEPWKWEWM